MTDASTWRTALLAALFLVSLIGSTSAQQDTLGEFCAEESALVFVCNWELDATPTSASLVMWPLPEGLSPSVIDLHIVADSRTPFNWGFCIESASGSAEACPVNGGEQPDPAAGETNLTRTVLIDFDPGSDYHFMIVRNPIVTGFAIAPAHFLVEGRFREISREVPAGGHAGTPEDPQLRDGTDEIAGFADIAGVWLDQHFLDDGLIEIGLVVPNVRDFAPGPNDMVTFEFSFTLLGERYISHWHGYEPRGGADDGWIVTLLSDRSPHTDFLSYPHVIDLANGTLSTVVPLSALGNPRDGDLFTDFAARSSRGTVVLSTEVSTTPADEASTMDRPFATGGPEVWNALAGADMAEVAAATPWMTAPLARENLPISVLLLLLALGGGAGTFVALGRRRASIARSTREGTIVGVGALVLAKYRVKRELGAGSGGRVFLAQDVRMDRKVVLKTLTSRDLAAAIREARAGAAVDHPNVVRVYDVEDLGAGGLIVMEYVNGGSLKERLATGGALSDPAFARVAGDLLGALAATHSKGAVHRDVKPANVLLTREGHAKLSDFGIARVQGFDATIGGAALGSVQYMAPEQARGKRVTAVSDLYSAAATLYEARTGEPLVTPITDESPVEMQMRVGAGRAFDAAIEPPALRAWFAKALAVAPEERYQSAAEMRDALGLHGAS